MIFKIAGIFLIALSIGMMVLAVFIFLESENYKSEVIPCYDKYGSELIGQKCLSQPPNKIVESGLCFFIAVMMIGCGVVVWSFDDFSNGLV